MFYILKERSLRIVYEIHLDFLTPQQATGSDVSGGPVRLSLRIICVYPTQPFIRERNLCSHNFLFTTPPATYKQKWI